MPFPDSTPNYNNKKDMEVSLSKPANWDKNDLSHVQEKFRDSGANGTNGTGNLQNGLLQFAASEISKGKNHLN